VLISIVTPILRRPEFIPIIRKIVASQRYDNFEWIIAEERDSYNYHQTNIPEAQYIIFDGGLNIGDKRNLLVERASGDIIVNFDADDYYSPSYLSAAAQLIGQYAAVNHDPLYLYSLRTRTVQRAVRRPYWGSGAVYTRAIWEQYTYPASTVKQGEDTVFFRRIAELHGLNRVGGLLATSQLSALMLAIRHGNNTTIDKRRGSVIDDPQCDFLKGRVLDPEILDFYLFRAGCSVQSRSSNARSRRVRRG
jgi:glycosyltransferase involved in cell wall biosynthesis